MQEAIQEPEYQVQEQYQPQPQQVVRNPLDQLKAAVNLAETMPPSKIRKNLIGLITLAPNIEDNLMDKIDLPMQIEDSDPKNPFLKTQFNRDGDSYRSFTTNQYIPQSEGYTPSPQFRKIQIMANVLFNEYTKLYYGPNGLGSFYVTEGLNQNVFRLGYFAKKQTEGDQDNNFVGSWNSFNIGVIQIQGQQFSISLTTTILIQMNIQGEKQGLIDLTGFLKKNKVQRRKLGKEKLESILVVFCEMVEDLETSMRQHLEAIYIGKTQEVIFSTRYEYTVEDQKHRKFLAENLKRLHLKG